jgi:hypothetical protein
MNGTDSCTQDGGGCVCISLGEDLLDLLFFSADLIVLEPLVAGTDPEIVVMIMMIYLS